MTSTLITIALGIIFLVGVIGFEWEMAPFGPAEGRKVRSST